MDNGQRTKLRISGMTCANCVTAVERALDALEGVNRNLDNLLRRFGRHFLNVHSTSFTGHHHDLGNGSIRNDALVKLFFDIQPLLHQDFLDSPSLGASLVGDQIHADNSTGKVLHLRLGLGQFYLSDECGCQTL